MEFDTIDAPGVLLLKPRFFHDARGYFVETYNLRDARAAGLTADFVQSGLLGKARHSASRGAFLTRNMISASEPSEVRIQRRRHYVTGTSGYVVIPLVRLPRNL
jgi:dTDP-4-dehydrorhamnose 3,5-epimerase-like enzyme